MIDRIAENGTTFSLCHEQKAALTGSWRNCDWVWVVEAAYPSVEMKRMKMEPADWFVGGKSYHLKIPYCSITPGRRQISWYNHFSCVNRIKEMSDPPCNSWKWKKYQNLWALAGFLSALQHWIVTPHLSELRRCHMWHKMTNQLT